MSEPLAKFQSRRVSAAVFKNEKKDGSGTFHTASVENAYKDDKGEYQKTNSFTEQELISLATVALQAADHITRERRKDTPKEEGEE